MTSVKEMLVKRGRKLILILSVCLLFKQFFRLESKLMSGFLGIYLKNENLFGVIIARI